MGDVCDKSRLARQAVLRTTMNTKMIERTPIRDHMIEFFNEIEILGVEIDGKT